MAVKYDDWLFGRDGALLRAAAFGDLDLARELVTEGANVNVASRCGTTPLHRAAQNGHLAMVKFLLDSGADASGSNNTPSPRQLAADAGHTEIAALLPPE